MSAFINDKFGIDFIVAEHSALYPELTTASARELLKFFENSRLKISQIDAGSPIVPDADVSEIAELEGYNCLET